ncbi:MULTISPECIES: hypothetical protein [Streptomyces]|uniref:Uncharacterized protein n=1 Tax=Streptomyces flaveolus TaxID=67297 RepID=A0ABV1VPT0_9ACTN
MRRPEDDMALLSGAALGGIVHANATARTALFPASEEATYITGADRKEPRT